MPRKRRKLNDSQPTDAGSDNDSDDTRAAAIAIRKQLAATYIAPAVNPVYKPYNERLSTFEDRGPCGTKEVHDTPLDIDAKVTELVELLEAAKRLQQKVVVFTGAGISTSCGVADFRGPNGVWTLEEKQHKQRQAALRKANAQSKENKPVNQQQPVDDDQIASATVTTSAHTRPSPAHMVLSALVATGHVHTIVSQNIDCLHLRSGVPRNQLVEMHGNLYAEQCTNYRSCGKEYIRSYDLNAIGCQPTGRLCDDQSCRAPLSDKTADWSTDLAYEEMSAAKQAFAESSLCIILGTSLRVDPAGRMPNKVLQNGGKVVVANLQKTYIDKQCSVRLFAPCDIVMLKVAKKLRIQPAEHDPELQLPPFLPRRRKYAVLKEKNVLIAPPPPAYMRQSPVKPAKPDSNHTLRVALAKLESVLT